MQLIDGLKFQYRKAPRCEPKDMVVLAAMAGRGFFSDTERLICLLPIGEWIESGLFPAEPFEGKVFNGFIKPEDFVFSVYFKARPEQRSKMFGRGYHNLCTKVLSASSELMCKVHDKVEELKNAEPQQVQTSSGDVPEQFRSQFD